MTVVWINCSSAPYIDMINQRQKLYETRNRRTLDPVIGRPVFLCESGRRGPSVVRSSARFGEPFAVRSREQWEALRPVHRVPAGSPYDWTDKTRVKWLYPVLDVVPVPVPFIPPEGTRYGRTWMECDKSKLEVVI